MYQCALDLIVWCGAIYFTGRARYHSTTPKTKPHLVYNTLIMTAVAKARVHVYRPAVKWFMQDRLIMSSAGRSTAGSSLTVSSPLHTDRLLTQSPERDSNPTVPTHSSRISPGISSGFETCVAWGGLTGGLIACPPAAGCTR